MNRRSFLSGASVLAAGLPTSVAMAKAAEQFGIRITVENPPEPGFEYMGSRRYKVFCNGEELQGVIRVDTGRGMAWRHARDEQGNLLTHRDENGNIVGFDEQPIRGHITVERIA